MKPHHSNFADSHDDNRHLLGGDKGTPRQDQFEERIRAFEECCMSDSAEITNFACVAAADLFRTMPHIEHAVIEEIKEAPAKQKRPALRRYVRTLQVLRQVLEASVA